MSYSDASCDTCSDTSSESSVLDQPGYIKQKILSCKCHECLKIRATIKCKFPAGISDNICEHVVCKTCSELLEHFEGLDFSINPCGDDDIDENTEIYVYLLVNKFPDDKMDTILDEKEMRFYETFKYFLKRCYQKSYSTICLCSVEESVNNLDLWDNEFCEKTFREVLRKILNHLRNNKRFICNNIFNENTFEELYARMKTCFSCNHIILIIILLELCLLIFSHITGKRFKE